MINQFNVGDIIQSTYSNTSADRIYFLVIEATHISKDNYLYKIKDIAYGIEMPYRVNDLSYKNYEIVSKAQRD
jgi:imidazole glycerol phosphate synthase subunit HisF